MTDSAAASPARRRWPMYVVGTLVGAVILFVIYTGAVFSFSYSEGERGGQLRKFSKKGWICKTWEGEVAQSISTGLAPEIWYFTVRDERVVKAIQAGLNKNVVLHYKEHPGIPTSCFGDTRYFVDSVVSVAP